MGNAHTSKNKNQKRLKEKCVCIDPPVWESSREEADSLDQATVMTNIFLVFAIVVFVVVVVVEDTNEEQEEEEYHKKIYCTAYSIRMIFFSFTTTLKCSYPLTIISISDVVELTRYKQPKTINKKKTKKVFSKSNNDYDSDHDDNDEH